MSGREPVDFFLVKPEHVAIHIRLGNWSRWARGGRGGGGVLPMFQNYRPDGYHELQGGGAPIDTLDAVALQKLFVHIPEKHRWALQWSYRYSFISVNKACRAFGMNRTGLADLVHDARSMLKNSAIRRTQGEHVG
jgi:hypothetical protein